MSRSPRKLKAAYLRLAAPLLFAVGLAAFIGQPAIAAENAGKGRVIIFLIDRVNYQEIMDSKAPTLKDLINSGAAGVSSSRTKENDNAAAQYLAIGAGNKAAGTTDILKLLGPAGAPEGFGADERLGARTAADIYRERTGRTFSKPMAANLSLGTLIKVNRDGDFEAVPGSMGSAIRGAGLKTAVIGNADAAYTYGRSAINIVMDTDGLVDIGYVSKDVLRQDQAFPSGYRTDRDKLLAAFGAAYGSADVIAVEWGDTDRVRSEAVYMTSQREELLVKSSLADADAFLGDLLATVDLKRDMIIVISPAPSAADVEENRLVTPVIMAGKDITPGLLTSASTRRQMTIVNVDIAPTVLAWLGIEQPSEMTGRPASGESYAGDKTDLILETTNRWVFVRKLMDIGLRAFAYWDIFIFALFMMLLMPKRLRPYAVRVRWLLLSVPTIPLVCLLLPILGYGSMVLVLVEAVALTALIVYAVYRYSRSAMEAFGIIGLAVTAAVLIDLAFGARLAQNSMLGYSVLNGARFYGIGNEYSGVLMGAVLLAAFYVASFTGRPASKAQKAGAIGIMVAALGLMGAPMFGAEFGSLLGAATGFGIMALGIIRGNYSARHIMVLVIAGILGIGAVVGYDLSRGAEGGSHVGRLVSQIGAEGLAPLGIMVERKLAMNFRLIQFAFWNWVNVVSMAVLAIAFYGLRNLVKLVSERYRYFRPMFVGGLVCCVGALVLNDSGVVAMAMIFLYLVPATLYLMTYEMDL